MKTRTASTMDGSQRWLVFWCPGCDQAHQIKVVGDVHPRWDWNGDRDKPTTNPSVRVMYSDTRNCHFFLKEGRIEFCGDSYHALKGQTVEIPEWPKPDWAGIDAE